MTGEDRRERSARLRRSGLASKVVEPLARGPSGLQCCVLPVSSWRRSSSYPLVVVRMVPELHPIQEGGRAQRREKNIQRHGEVLAVKC